MVRMRDREVGRCYECTDEGVGRMLEELDKNQPSYIPPCLAAFLANLAY